MDEALFIDNVDLEWGFRARRAGYRLYGCFAARMGHRIGEAERHLAGLRVRDHAPLRQYYMTRNRIALYRRPYTPWAWIVHDVPRLTLKALYLTLIAERRREHRRMLVAAVRDVRRGHFGHFEAQD
jgi:rhamnosyltransferase